jgi:DNA-directed RNA polymerase specialized sigma24 family protein
MNDQNRWKEFRQGNQTVFVDIFLTYYDDLFRYSKRWLQDEEQIKDLIQDLFLNFGLNGKIWAKSTILKLT